MNSPTNFTFSPLLLKLLRPHQIAPIIIAFLVLPLLGCQSPSSPAYELVSPAEIEPGEAIPAPTEEVILTFSGKITIHNVENKLEFDMATLEKLGLSEYTVHDPWLNEEITYTGILVSDLVGYLGATDEATRLRLTALDDYQVEITLADIEKWPILLATQFNGAYMDVAGGGPTRIVFPYHAYDNIDSVVYDDLWIWSLETIEVQ